MRVTSSKIKYYYIIEMNKKEEKFRGGRGGNMNTLGAVAAGSVLGGASSGGDMAGVSCPTSDTSFHCKLTRFTQDIRMILMLIIIFGALIALFYFLYNMMKKKRR